MNNVRLLLGDSRDVLKTLPDNSVDSIVTDPPYGLSFMGKKWDYDVPGVDVWVECLRVLKPGGHLLAFAGTRTQHRMACRIEDAGFEIRDMIAWVYGSGFPKSHNLDGDKEGWGTALKPALEPITVARKPFDTTVAENVQEFGTGALNIAGCRVETLDSLNGGAYSENRKPSTSEWVAHGGTIHNSTGEAYTQTTGRWPANFIHDGSEEVVALFPVATSGKPCGVKAGNNNNVFGQFAGGIPVTGFGDTGSAVRFFKCFPPEETDLIFCRAKAILSAWQLTRGVQPCSQKSASVVGPSLSLSKQAADSVLSDAVIAASRGDKRLSDVKGLFTTVTEKECEMLCETLITAMLISESDASPAPSRDAPIQNGCRVSIAAIRKPIDTTTITISLPTSDGFAEPVTFSIMPASSVHGGAGCASRFKYCPKASKQDRDEGLDHMPEVSCGMMEDDNYDIKTGSGNPRDTKRKNAHPTVKPTDLMRYLCRLVTPRGGIVLDPFMGSGSTGKAAALEGFRFIGIELDPAHIDTATARIGHAKATASLPAQMGLGL